MLSRKGLNMSDEFKISLAQLNATVGDLSGNTQKVMEAWEIARDQRSDLIAFPELFITGYNPQDLILKTAFQKAAKKASKDGVSISDEERSKLVSTEQSLSMDAEPKIPSSIVGLENFTFGTDSSEEEKEETEINVDYVFKNIEE